jgi:two-component sensor histidine kinase
MRLSRRTGVETSLVPWLADAEQGRKRVQRLYVAAAAGLAALVPLILFAGFWIRAELNKSERDVESYLSARASMVSRRVDGAIEQQLLALRAISALPALDDGTDPAFSEIANRVAAVMPNWLGLGLVDAVSGRPIAANRADWPPPQALGALAGVKESRKPSIVAAIQPGPQPSPIFLSVPVVRNDEVRLALVAALDAAELQRIALLESQDSSLLLTIADGGDRIIARSRAPETAIGQPVTNSFREGVAGRNAGLFQGISREGEAVSSAFVRSNLTGWVAVAAIDRGKIDKFSKGSVWATIAAGALSLILAGILAVFIVHTIMERRVSEERLAASRALGELDARLLKTTQEALGEQRKASSEREVLLREIYHRVKNNLQIVQSLLRLGSRELSPEQREPFESAVRRIGAMARVHTLLYNSPDLASIDFKIYLDELLRELSDAFGGEERGIHAALDAESMRIPLDTAVPLAFIAVELLTNAYRHAFPDGRQGRIIVALGRDEPFGTLRIEDNGIGFDRAAAPRRRLGLTIVRKLVQQIGGGIEEPDDGSSSFLIRFPLDHVERGNLKDMRLGAMA